MKSLKEISKNIISLSEGMFDMEGGDRLEKVVAKDSTKMFLDNCKGNFDVVYFKDGSCRVNGKLIISRIESDKLYVNIKDFHGNLIIENCPNLTTFEGSFLEKHAVFDGSLTINQCPSLVSVKGLPGLIKGDLSITNCKKLKSVEGIDTVFGSVYWQGNGKKFTAEQLKDKIHVIRKIFCGGEEIDADVTEELISEAFNNPWLQRLAAQLKRHPYKEYSYRDDSPMKYDSVDRLFTRYGRTTVAGGRLLDKITSEDIDVYDMSDEKDKKALAKAFYNSYSAQDANASDIILIYKEDIGEFIGGLGNVAKARGRQGSGINWIYLPHESINREMTSSWMTKTEAKDKLLSYGSGYTVIVINSGSQTGSGEKERDKIKGARQEAQRGMINPGDVDQYKKIAADNIKRYKNLIAQMKLEKKKNDETAGYDKVIEEYEKINLRILKLIREVAKNPKGYNRWDISHFLEWLRDERKLLSVKRYEYYGEYGLMYYFKYFMEQYLQCYGNGYKAQPDESDYKNLESAANKLKEAMNKADDKLKSLGV